MILSFSDMFLLTDVNDWKGNQQNRNCHQKKKNLSKIIMGKQKSAHYEDRTHDFQYIRLTL